MEERVLEEREQATTFGLFLKMALEGADFSGEGETITAAHDRPIDPNGQDDLSADHQFVSLLKCKVCREPVPSDLEARIRKRIQTLG